LNWFDAEKRDLPWRKTKDPYRIWISEIILQQTKVAQGLDYYQKITSSFPDVYQLASASEESVLKHWQGLGYYSRARNMHAAANRIVEDYGGIFPASYEELIKLPGVGPYTAGAVASIAFNKAEPVVDGNVYRVLSRLFGIHTPIDSTAGQKEFRALAREIIDEKRPGDFNQSLMELGARICVPVSPKCDICPVSGSCFAHHNHITKALPVKSPRKTPKPIWLHYFLIRADEGIIIKKRTGKGIWKNLYDFPCIEHERKMPLNEWIQEFFETYSIPKSTSQVVSIIEIEHILTHRKIFATFYEIEASPPSKLPADHIVIPIDQFGNYPVSRLIDIFWKKWIE
jgi:A/G-specific adenine glycosylase